MKDHLSVIICVDEEMFVTLWTLLFFLLASRLCCSLQNNW